MKAGSPISLDFDETHNSGVTFQAPISELGAGGISRGVGVFETPLVAQKEETKRISIGELVELEGVTPKSDGNVDNIMKVLPKILMLCLIVLLVVFAVLAVQLAQAVEETENVRSPENNLLPTTTPTSQPTQLPTTTPTSQPTQLPTTSPSPNPTRNPTAFPTSEPTNNPTSFPTNSPTGFPTGLFEFNFQRRNNIKEICGPNMDPSYAINGRFFSACAEGRSLVCFQDDKDDTLGVLEEFRCDGIGLQCLCPELLLFTPVEAEIRAEDLCGGIDAPEPLECSMFL